MKFSPQGRGFRVYPRVTILASHWYKKLVHPVVEACSSDLLAKGVSKDDLHVVEVAGAFELPCSAARLIEYKDTNRRPDAVICVVCIVKDSTNMCETLSEAVGHGIADEYGITKDHTPVIYVVLSCESGSQAHSCAEKRSCGGIVEDHKCNHGVAWAQSALQMAHLKRCASVKEMERCSCVSCESRSRSKSGDHKKTEKYESCMHEKCTSCGLSEKKCSRDACRGCGCPADKCSCQGCNCAVCSGEKTDKATCPSSEHTTTKEEGIKVKPSEPMKHEKSPSSGSLAHGKCGKCVSPGDNCKCSLLH
ncbi:hypothetical protein PsorP6_003837 [Peronosclerospora sorghi]|uniref:Uncharacterized protein n=1 Tax=Peronosclerospora sorghi TaxID=230839 RepID=A0ACC0VKR1_9STRA|nr:hypothetical protein PsorP6_003837 [Peronosclerospora sorghi]